MENAQKINAFQQNNNILIDDKSTVNTKPQLEIFADEVECAHGSTIGQISEEELFYLRSRGINLDNAKQEYLDAVKLAKTKPRPTATITKDPSFATQDPMDLLPRRYNPDTGAMDIV